MRKIIYLIILPVIVVFSVYLISDGLTGAPSGETAMSVDSGYDDLRNQLIQCLDGKDNKNICFDTVFAKAITTEGSKEITKKFNSIEENDTRVASYCHSIIHALGREILIKEETVDAAMAVCDHTCNSGCYHGVIEGFFRKDEDEVQASTKGHVSVEEIKAKAITVCPPDASVNILDNCLHGLGHAMMYFLDYNLREVLPICDQLDSVHKKERCWSGAFMENSIPRESHTSYISETDYHFPCNSVGDKYKPICYIMQTPRMSRMGLSDEEITQECKNAGKYYGYCIHGIGRDHAFAARIGKYRDASMFCENIDRDDGKYKCLQGSVETLVNHTWNGELVYPFCGSFANEDWRILCYHLSQEKMINKGYKTQTEAIEECIKYAGGDPQCTLALTYIHNE